MVMDNNNQVYKIILDVFNTQVQPELEQPMFQTYPFEKAWKGHNQAIKILINSDKCILTSPTGTGKTSVYLTALAEIGHGSIVIAPRNGLQLQVVETGKKMGLMITYLFDRSKHCNKEGVPCKRKYKKKGRWFFKYNGKEMEYPCDDCPYEHRKRLVKDVLRRGGVAVLNQGNFWGFLNLADFIIVDEADETLRAIQEAVAYPEPIHSDDPKEVLSEIFDKLRKDKEKVEKLLENERNDFKLQNLNNLLNKIERKIRKTEFFLSLDPNELIVYRRGKKTYVEWFREDVYVADRLFNRYCLVTATPSSSNVKKVHFELPFRAKVIYYPIGNLSERNVFRRGNKDLLEKAVEFIVETYDYIVKLTGMKKAPIHTGNLGKHGKMVYDLLIENGRSAILMEEGKQLKAIQEFLNSDVDFLCAVAIEYGYDWGFSPVQYVLKVPYAYYGDPRIMAIKKLLRDKFDEWYSWDAMSRLIQACGRNARNPNDFGITFILDSHFGLLYEKFKHKLPEWFKSRLVFVMPDVTPPESNEEVGE